MAPVFSSGAALVLTLAGVALSKPLTLHATEDSIDENFVPTYPDIYTVKGFFRIPYAEIVEPVEVHTDRIKKRQSVSFYNGLDGYIYLDVGSKDARSYELYIAKDHRVCDSAELEEQYKGQGAEGKASYPVSFLPDLSVFKYKGKSACTPFYEGKCHKWQYSYKQGDMVNHYEFYAKDDTQYTPVVYSMVGYDLPFSSHYDMYKIEYQSFSVGVNESAFELPSECNLAPQDRVPAHHSALEDFGSLFSAFDHVPDKFHSFMNKHKKEYEVGSEEYSLRHKHFRTNLRKINNMNRQATGVTYGFNHLADMSLEERRRLNGYRPKKANSQDAGANDMPESVHVISGKKLPEQVDWRHSGAVSPVKDQGKCGSCWTFSATQAIESAWYLATGDLFVLSPQQLVDCAWSEGNSGCDGGDEVDAMKYVHKVGGLMRERDYRYTGEDGYCVFNSSMAAARVHKVVRIPKGDEHAMRDALATAGPVSIAFDASRDTLSFYSSGVYYDKECSSEDLDHAVVVVGYGTENGKDYWLVKNSWSTYWGDMGYVKIARNRHNHCGVATSAAYAVVDTSLL
eukprot:comp22820_c0_seq1/m.35838 comp22820_c0_seq1/g.35838  ORF comp22820_c0_seq1/g.35838 comp22820_c0_seq1/m.35838 type:complete len:568 (-) comp22820_c0_seq1:537-2240(-)